MKFKKKETTRLLKGRLKKTNKQINVSFKETTTPSSM